MKKWIPLLALLCIVSYSSKADHTGGAEITYKTTTTPGIFEVHLIYYRDCNGIPICTNSCGAACDRTLQIMGVDGSFVNTYFGSFTVSLVNVRDINNNWAEGVKSTCSNMNCATPGTYTPAKERYEFVGFANIGTTTSIPANCCNIRFVFSECCRPAEINTGSSWQNFYIDATVNRCLAINNSSPDYTYDPVAILCGGQNVQYNMGASYDPDGDSLTYAFAPALEAFGSSVTYDPPFAYNKPLPWTGASNGTFPAGIKCDTFTGRVLFTPGNSSNDNFYGVICVEIKQWRKISGIPTLIGKTSRDMTVTILANCAPNNVGRLITYPPAIPTNPNSPKLSWVFPSGIQTCFTMVAKDPDYSPPLISDTTVVDTTNSFPRLGGVFTRLASAGTFREDSMRFCWTPTIAQQSDYPYILSIKVRDSRKPMEGKSMYPISITVPRSLMVESVSDSALTCYSKQFKYKLQPNSSLPVRADWSVYKLTALGNVFVDSISNATSINYTFADTALYQVNVYLLGNSLIGSPVVITSDTVKINASSLQITGGTDTTLCKNASILLSALVSGGKSPYTIRWTDNQAQYTGLTRLVTVSTQNKIITVKVTDSVNCSVTDTIKVNVFAAKIQRISDTIQCEKNNQFKLFNNTNDSVAIGVTYRWQLDDSITFLTDTIQFSLASPGTHNLKLITQTSQGCYDTAQQKLVLYASPKISFIVNDSTQCLKGNSFICTDSSTNNGGGMTYQWRSGTTNAVTTNFTIAYSSAGIQSIRLIATSAVNTTCKDTLIRKMYVYAQPTVASTINTVSQCIKGNKFVFTNTTPNRDSSLLFKWTIDGISYTTDTVIKNFTSTGTKTAKLKMTSSFGCKDDSTTKTITILASPTATFTMSDSAKCLKGNSFTFTNTSIGVTSGSFEIDEYAAPITTTTVIKNFTGVGMKNVRLVVINNVGCRDTLNKKVEVWYSPTSSFVTSHTSICPNVPITFTNTSSNPVPVTPKWTFSDGTFDNLPTVIKSFTSSGNKMISLVVVTENGCSDNLVKNVMVLPTPATPVISGPASFKPDSTVTYAVVSNPLLKYKWQVINGQFVSTNLDTNSVKIQWQNTADNGQISLFTENTDGCLSDTARYNVSIIGAVGLTDLNASFKNVSVFPNPATDAIVLLLNSKQVQHVHVRLYNMVGSEVKHLSYEVTSGMMKEEIDLHELQRGIYFMRIEGETGSQTVKIQLK